MPSNREKTVADNWVTTTDTYHLVYSYCGLSYEEQMNTNVIEHRLLTRDAMINQLRKSEEGIEYLENAWCYKQDGADKDSIRKQFGGK